ncbi:MAG: ABC transporter ATP-binding protein [Actinomycetia bacterium]|nr:ABC transporter ATP-binding protein [Actinomycetes bacterium]
MLSVRNLRCEFAVKDGTVAAVEDVSFEVDTGQTLAIVGESGSGKSVTVLSIMGLLSETGMVTGGRIRFNGQTLAGYDAGNGHDLAEGNGKTTGTFRPTNGRPESPPVPATPEAEPKRLKKNRVKPLPTIKESEYCALRGSEMAMIFQEPMTSLNPVYRVGRQIVEAISAHQPISKGEAWAHAVEMLRWVGIPSPEQRARDYPHQMSGGMRQRVMIAMALACSPKLLIADEPTTALDVTIQAQILDLINRLRSETQMAVLLVTHDLGVVSEVADKVVVMYCGQVVEAASARELFEKPLHPYTLGLLKSVPSIDDDDSGRLYMIKGSVPNPLHMPPGCHFSDRCDSCMDVCRKDVPRLINHQRTHMVRCHLYEKALGDDVS